MTEIEKIFSFKKMISLVLMKWIYFIGLIGLIVWSISFFLKANIINIIVGALVLFVGNLFWRLFCEIWILLFKIHRLLEESEKHLKVLSDTVKQRQ